MTVASGQPPARIEWYREGDGICRLRNWLWRYQSRRGLFSWSWQGRKCAPGILRVNGLSDSNLRKVARAVQRRLLPFKPRFSPFGVAVFLVCHWQSSLMLKEYRPTHRGILDWYRRSRVIVG